MFPKMIAGIGFVPIGLGNLIPLIGVLLFDWDLPSILVMYWIEIGVVGLVNVLRIQRSEALGHPSLDPGDSVGRPILTTRGTGGWLLAGLWLLVYGVFWAILGLSVIPIANGGFYEGASRTGWSGASGAVIAWGTLSLVGGQLVAFVLDYVIGRRYLTVTPLELLRDPFARILVVIVTIASGGAAIAVVGSPIGFLVAMVVAKTAVEIWFVRTGRSA